MSYVVLQKDVGGLGDERKVELEIRLCLSGKVDSRVTQRYVSKEFKDCMDMAAPEEDTFCIHLIKKLDKKTAKAVAAGDDVNLQFFPLFMEEFFEPSSFITRLRGAMSKMTGYASNSEALVYCDLLFIAVLLDACPRSCRTKFPWYIGGEGSVSTQITMLDLMTNRKDFNATAKTASDTAKMVAAGTGAYASTLGAAVGVDALAIGVATGSVTAAGMATSASVAGAAVASGATALAGGAGVGGAAAAGAATFTAGAEAAAAFGGVAVGAAALPVTLAVAGVGLAIMTSKALFNATASKVYKTNMSVLQRYAELVQRGNLGRYCQKNELNFHEIWVELAEKCDVCGASDIFDLENKISILL